MSKHKTILKLSGNSLSYPNVDFASANIDPKQVKHYALNIHEVFKRGINPFTIIGGSNIANGEELYKRGFVTDKRVGDLHGMEGTHENVQAVYEALRELDVPVICLSATGRNDEVFVPYTYGKILELSEKNELICLIAGGTGFPGLTTDSAAALYAKAVGVQTIIKSTEAGCVYSHDPRDTTIETPPTVYPVITYRQVVLDNLKIMDLAAVAYCEQNDIDIQITRGEDPDTIEKIVIYGENPNGSLITNDVKKLKLSR